MSLLVTAHNSDRLPIFTAVNSYTRNGLYGDYSMPYHAYSGTNIGKTIGYTLGCPKMGLHAWTISPCAGNRVAFKGDTSYRSGKLNYSLQYSNITNYATMEVSNERYH
jgi:hypothetical protein